MNYHFLTYSTKFFIFQQVSQAIQRVIGMADPNRLSTSNEIKKVIDSSINSKLYNARYRNVFKGDKKWQSIKSPKGLTYNWNNKSTYVQHPPLFKKLNLSIILKKKKLKNIN